MSKGPLPAIPSTQDLQGAYRGFGLGLEVGDGNGVQTSSQVVHADLEAAAGAYNITFSDEDRGAVLLSRETSTLEFIDFSEDNLSSNDFEGVSLLPITDTELLYVRFSGDGFIAGQFINYSAVRAEGGILSRNPDFVIPDFIDQETHVGFPAVLAGAEPISEAPGWFSLDWFKEFYPMEGTSSIFHDRLGWLFYSENDADSLLLWDVAMHRWFWTKPSSYPWMYAYGTDGGWVFFIEDGRPGNRQFRRGDTGELVSEEQLGL
jgi:hypothetical protein